MHFDASNPSTSSRRLFSARMNFVLDQMIPQNASPEKRLRASRELIGREEVETDPQPRRESFGIDGLRFQSMNESAQVRVPAAHRKLAFWVFLAFLPCCGYNKLRRTNGVCDSPTSTILIPNFKIRTSLNHNDERTCC